MQIFKIMLNHRHDKLDYILQSYYFFCFYKESHIFATVQESQGNATRERFPPLDL